MTKRHGSVNTIRHEIQRDIRGCRETGESIVAMRASDLGSKQGIHICLAAVISLRYCLQRAALSVPCIKLQQTP
jgi:hypothetical protein